MKIYTLRKEQRVPLPLDKVFAFFEKPENLATITPPWLGFRTLTPSPIVMKRGAEFEYRIRVMGVRMRWRSLISDYQPPVRFVDEQVKGPYAYWHHTHTFSEAGNGTLVGDEVRYALPFGVIGRMARTLFVARQLEDIFAYRSRVIKEMFSQGGAHAQAGPF
jgi:ligand-binding SRPBCC domain-containing protein